MNGSQALNHPRHVEVGSQNGFRVSVSDCQNQQVSLLRVDFRKRKASLRSR